jgi:heptose-I-phosphate ethanolaminephosphotransferase
MTTMMRNELSKAWPPLKGMMFCLLPLAYYLAGALNSSQAGKAALLGFLTLTTLFSWRDLFPGRRVFRFLILFSLLLLIVNIVYQAILRQKFGVQQDDVLIVQALASTNVEEARGFVSQYLRNIAVHLLASMVFLFSYWRLVVGPVGSPGEVRRTGAGRRIRLLAASIITILLIAIHADPSVRKANPLFYFFYNYQKASLELAMASELNEELRNGGASQLLAGMHQRADAGRRTVVLVIGESDTRNNWSLYGYGRQTTPELAKVRDDLVIFRDVVSADGATVGSISKMLTAATLREPDLWKKRPTVMAIARHFGYKVFWIANQGSENRGVVPILAAQAETTLFTNKEIDRGESTLDGVLLAPYRQALDDPADRKLIVVHLLGAHPAYNFRYPKEFSIFEKIYDDPVAEDLNRQGRAPWAILFRNMYDCAIRYEDHILAQLLNGLKEKESSSAVWLYVSDHGQDVAHNTDYSGHNIRVRQQWEVPLLLWQSEDQQWQVPAAELAVRPYQADVIDHTILGLLGIEGDLYDPELDILSTKFKKERILPRQMRGASYD